MKLEQLPETNEIERREAAPTWQSWLEIAGLVGALLAVGGLIDAHDPFLVRREFSWFILAPLLAGLQYGASHGLLCGAAQALALAIAWKAGITSVPDSIAQVVLGWLAAGLLAGEFHDAWQRRIRRVEASSERLRTRLTSLGRAYLALKVSHDELEREGPGRPASLRDALASFQRALAGRSDSASLESLGDLILALFAEHAFVHVAAGCGDRHSRAGLHRRKRSARAQGCAARSDDERPRRHRRSASARRGAARRFQVSGARGRRDPRHAVCRLAWRDARAARHAGRPARRLPLAGAGAGAAGRSGAAQ